MASVSEINPGYWAPASVASNRVIAESLAWCSALLCSLPTAAPCHPARPTEPTAAPVAARTEQPPGDPECLHCLHTHLARDSTQITLIHFKPTLSQEALQQILLKPYLHNVGPGPIPIWGHLERAQQLVSLGLKPC